MSFANPPGLKSLEARVMVLERRVQQQQADWQQFIGELLASVNPLLEKRIPDLEQFSADITTAFNPVVETRLPQVETMALQTQVECRNITQALKTAASETAVSNWAKSLFANLSQVRTELATLRLEHGTLKHEHEALLSCMLEAKVVQPSHVRLNCGLSSFCGCMGAEKTLLKVCQLTGDSGVSMAHLSMVSRSFASTRASISVLHRKGSLDPAALLIPRNVDPITALPDVDTTVYDKLKDYDPSPEVLEKWVKSETVQGVLPGIRLGANVGLTDTLRFDDVFAIIERLSMTKEQFVNKFTEFPCVGLTSSTSNLEKTAKLVLTKVSTCTEEGRELMRYSDLFRLLEIIGFTLKRFKSAITGVEVDEQADVPPVFEKIGDYNIHRQLGGGHKGVICYLGEHVKDSAKVAIKWPAVKQEAEVLKEIQALNDKGELPIVGLPKLMAHDIHQEQPYVVIGLLGSTLHNVFERLGKSSHQQKWSAMCVIGRLLVRRFQSLHSCGFVHCDVSPTNVMLGSASGTSAQKVGLYLIDFEHAQKYPGTKLEKYSGSLEWSSIRCTDGIEPLPEDDLQALGWVLLNGLIGKLPWMDSLESAYKQMEDSRWTRQQIIRQVQRAKMKLLEPNGLQCVGGKKSVQVPDELIRFIQASGPVGTTEASEESRTTGSPNYSELIAILGGSAENSVGEEEDLNLFAEHVMSLM